MVAGCALAGFDFGALFEDKTVYTEVRQAETLGAGDTVQIIVDSEHIRLGLSDDAQAHVTYSDSAKRPHRYAYENGVLSLHADSTSRKWYEWVDFSFAPAQRVVEVLLPAGFHGTVEVTGATGNIDAEGLAGLERLVLTMTTGDIRLSGCEAAEATLTTTTGRLLIANHRGGALHAACTSGELRLDGLAGDTLTLRSISGSIALANAACDTVTASATTGSIWLDRLVANVITLCVTTGDVTGTIACDPTAFTIDSATVTGENNLGTVHFGGERKLTVNTTTGNIQVTFVE